MSNNKFKTSNMKEYKKEYNSNWYKKNKERKMEYQRQYRARKKQEKLENQQKQETETIK